MSGRDSAAAHVPMAGPKRTRIAMEHDNTTQNFHPSTAMLDAYCHGDETNVPAIEAHLAGCDACRLKVAETVRASVQRERQHSQVPGLQ